MAGAIEAQAQRGRPAATGRAVGPEGGGGGVRARPRTAAQAGARRRSPARPARLSKDAYQRQRTALDAELTRLGLRKNHLELAMGDPSVSANFVELRRVTSELADVDAALAAAEDAWLEMEERAP